MSETGRYGISVSLPDGDPFTADHLLGPDWHREHWFDTEQARDAAYQRMIDLPPYYRVGDSPSVKIVKLDPD